MSEKEEKSIGVKVLASVSSITLMISLLVLFVAGASLTTSLIAAAAFTGLAGPAVSAGDTFAECLGGIFEMFMEGIAAIFDVISAIFSSF